MARENAVEEYPDVIYMGRDTEGAVRSAGFHKPQNDAADRDTVTYIKASRVARFFKQRGIAPVHLRALMQDAEVFEDIETEIV